MFVIIYIYLSAQKLTMPFYMTEQRKLAIKALEPLCEKYMPCEKDIFLAQVMYDTGLCKKTAQEYLKVLYLLKKFYQKTENDGRVLLYKRNIESNKDGKNKVNEIKEETEQYNPMF